MASVVPEPPEPKLNVRFFKDEPDIWLFLDYGGGDLVNLDYRWAIEHFTTADGFEWWGVISPLPRAATHERALDGVTREMELAKEAIRLLKSERAG